MLHSSPSDVRINAYRKKCVADGVTALAWSETGGTKQVHSSLVYELDSDSPASPASGTASSIVGDWRYILYSANSETRTGEHSNRCLRTWTRSSSFVASGGSNPDVQ